MKLYTLTTVDPVFERPTAVQTLTLDEARRFVNYKGIAEYHDCPRKWTLVNPKGFVVAAFDSLKMFGYTPKK